MVNHKLGIVHIEKYYGTNVSILELNKIIDWTKCAYTYLHETFTVIDKIIIYYIYFKRRTNG